MYKYSQLAENTVYSPSAFAGLEVNANAGASVGSADKKDKATSATRIKAIDTLRGIALFLMIFVNYDAGYDELEHAAWNGLKLADWVMPTFIFVAGASMPFSMKKQSEGASQAQMFLVVTKRSCYLILWGLFLTGVAELWEIDDFRVPGVLQRIGLSYWLCGIVAIFIPPYPASWDSRHRDIASLAYQHLFVLLFFVGAYLLIIFFVPYVGCKTDGTDAVGYLGPGGLADNGEYRDCTGGAVGYLDRKIFTDNHLFRYPSCRQDPAILCPMPFDPEGLVATLPSAFTMWLGYQAGWTILSFKTDMHPDRSILIRYAVWGFTALLLGLGLAGFSQDDGWIPINKNLWSVSFVLVCAGSDFLALAVLFGLLDVLMVSFLFDGGIFRALGLNSILIYICHSLWRGYIPWRFPAFFSRTDPYTDLEQMCVALSCALLYGLFALYLHKHKLYYAL